MMVVAVDGGGWRWDGVREVGVGEFEEARGLLWASNQRNSPDIDLLSHNNLNITSVKIT
jgi:hypothetical protein